MKVARTVLRGAGRSDASRLPDLELGAHVRKGESGSFSVFYSSARKTDTDRQTGETTEKTIRFMKWNHVFNASQIEGLPAHYYPEPLDPKAIGALSAGVQAFLDAIPIRVVHGGDSAHYTPSTDTVTLPPPQAFHSMEAYFSTRCHELGHNAVTRIMPHGIVGSRVSAIW